MIPTTYFKDWRRLTIWILGAVAVGVTIYYGGRALLSDRKGPVKLVVYGFSTQEEVLTQSIFPAFEHSWEVENGQDLIIDGVFGPSGTLAQQILLGAPADVALLSNEQHIKWLKAGRQVDEYIEPAVVSYTPMVIVTREGNPKFLSDFGDLAQAGVNLVHADPRSSGAGDWGLLAEYGSVFIESGNASAAEEQLKAIWHNVRLLGASARTTLTLFELGAGDAMVTYEQDARLAQDRGIPLEIVLPARTIVAEHVVVIVDSNVTRSERPVAEAFIRFLLSETSQQTFIRYHLRVAEIDGETFPPLANLFTVAELGGWSRIYPHLVEDVWQTEIEPRLDLDSAFNLLEMDQY